MVISAKKNRCLVLRLSFALFAALVLCVSRFGTRALARSDDNLIRQYPDGGYGLDLGDGYDVEPDGSFQPPAAYREDYRNTPYGPSMGRGFEVFPSTVDYGKPAKTEEELRREKEMKGYIFHEATTSPRGSNLWGVSEGWYSRAPRKRDRKVFWYEPPEGRNQ